MSLFTNAKTVFINNKEVKSIITNNNEILYENSPSELSLSLSTNKSILSHYDGDTCTLTATLINDNTPIENTEIAFYKDNILLDTDVTNSNGEATYTYESNGDGEVTIRANYSENNNNIISDTCNIVDACFYRETITSYLSLSNVTVIPTNFQSTFKINISNMNTGFKGIVIGSGMTNTLDFGMIENGGVMGIKIYNQNKKTDEIKQANVYSENVEIETVYTYVDGVQTITANNITKTLTNSTITGRNYFNINVSDCTMTDLTILPINNNGEQN